MLILMDVGFRVVGFRVVGVIGVIRIEVRNMERREAWVVVGLWWRRGRMVAEVVVLVQWWWDWGFTAVVIAEIRPATDMVSGFEIELVKDKGFSFSYLTLLYTYRIE